MLTNKEKEAVTKIVNTQIKNIKKYGDTNTLKCINEEEVSENEKYKCKKCKCFLKYVEKQKCGATTRMFDERGNYFGASIPMSFINVYECPKCGREYEE